MGPMQSGAAAALSCCTWPLCPKPSPGVIVVRRTAADLPELSVGVRRRVWAPGGIVTQFVTRPRLGPFDRVGGFTDPPRRRPDLGKRRFDARIGHVLGMIKHFGEPGGLFVPKPSPCLATLGLDAPGRGDDPWMATLPYGLPSISSYVK